MDSRKTRLLQCSTFISLPWLGTQRQRWHSVHTLYLVLIRTPCHNAVWLKEAGTHRLCQFPRIPFCFPEVGQGTTVTAHFILLLLSIPTHALPCHPHCSAWLPDSPCVQGTDTSMASGCPRAARILCRTTRELLIKRWLHCMAAKVLQTAHVTNTADSWHDTMTS